jgi:LacI family transcriptional regulator
MKHHKNDHVTIAQVAREAGVSTQTVSRVINNRQEISLETRQRVQDIINKMHYHPNVIARSLSQRRSHSLGVAASGIEYYGPSRSLLGIEQAANKLGYSIILSLVHHPEDGNVEKIFRNLVSRQVDGIIWQVPSIGDNHVWLHNEVQSINTPVIFMDTQPSELLNTVSMDNYVGGRIATEHLLSQGYKKIGLITGPLSWLSAQKRRQGWQDAMKSAGCLFDNCQMAEGDWTAGSGEQVCTKLFEAFPEMEAVFVSNDQMALGVYQTAYRMGKRIPEDLTVVGFDDIPESAHFCPRLTTVQQDLFELGNLAVQAFVNTGDVEQGGESTRHPQTLVIQPKLIIRESSMIENHERSVHPKMHSESSSFPIQP